MHLLLGLLPLLLGSGVRRCSMHAGLPTIWPPLSCLRFVRGGGFVRVRDGDARPSAGEPHPHMQRALDTRTEYCASTRIALLEAAAVAYRTRTRSGRGLCMLGPRMLLSMNRVDP